MGNPFIGQITLFPFNFAPVGWALCEGQLLPIAQYAAVFSLLGVQFGGNGTSNFALPDLRGRVPIGQGQGPGLSSYSIGSMQGVELVTLTTATSPCPFAWLPGFRGGCDDQCAERRPACRSARRRAGRRLCRQHLYRSRDRQSEPGRRPGRSGDSERRGPQQPAALSDAELVHCAAGRFPAA